MNEIMINNQLQTFNWQLVGQIFLDIWRKQALFLIIVRCITFQIKLLLYFLE